MDKNLEMMLEYQKLDIQLKRLLDTLEKSDASKKMEQARSEFNSAKKTVLDSEKEAEGVVTAYEQSTPQYGEISDTLHELELMLENVDISELDGFDGRLEALKDKVVALEKKLFEYRASSERLVKSYQDANAIGHKMKEVFNSAKDEYNALVEESKPEVNAIKKQLREMEPQLDAELLTKYKAVTAENKYPVFVEAYLGEGNIYSCTGCGLQLSQKNTSTLNENGMCTCETCRRVIYKR
ncbi:MAG: hypothetical protein E7350_01050 [Clostridiales bacterium]|nr:hypothetical protein [Clostridiales bacterium]